MDTDVIVDESLTSSESREVPTWVVDQIMAKSAENANDIPDCFKIPTQELRRSIELLGRPVEKMFVIAHADTSGKRCDKDGFESMLLMLELHEALQEKIYRMQGSSGEFLSKTQPVMVLPADTTIGPDEVFLSNGKRVQIVYSFSDFDNESLLCHVDSAYPERWSIPQDLSAASELSPSGTLCVDHHHISSRTPSLDRNLPGGEKLDAIVRSTEAVSTTVMIYSLAKHLGIPITSYFAKEVLIGLIDDTSVFGQNLSIEDRIMRASLGKPEANILVANQLTQIAGETIARSALEFVDYLSPEAQVILDDLERQLKELDVNSRIKVLIAFSSDYTETSDNFETALLRSKIVQGYKLVDRLYQNYNVGGSILLIVKLDLNGPELRYDVEVRAPIHANAYAVALGAAFGGRGGGHNTRAGFGVPHMPLDEFIEQLGFADNIYVMSSQTTI